VENEIIPWENMNQVPKVFRQLQGGRLNLDQCNLICKTLAIKHARLRPDGRLDPDYAKARAEFMSTHNLVQKGNIKIWIKNGGNA